MTWAARRQVTYLLGTFIALVLLVGLPLFFYFYEKPSCADGIQNGTEEGPDCGGACEKVCDFQAIAPIVHWQQEFEIVSGVYSVVALVENANDSFEAVSVPYIFRLYDSQNVFVAERKGRMYLQPHAVIPVFETNIKAGERTPTRVTFAFEKDPLWVHSTFMLPDVDVMSRRFDDTSETPRLLVTLRNNTLDSFSKIPVVAVLYDATDNAVHASRTVVSRLLATSDTEIVFTWPEEFSTPIARVEVTPLFVR